MGVLEWPAWILAAGMTVAAGATTALQPPLAIAVAIGAIDFAGDGSTGEGRASLEFRDEAGGMRVQAVLRDVDFGRAAAFAGRWWPRLAAQAISAGKLDLTVDCRLQAWMPADCMLHGSLRGLAIQGLNSAEDAAFAFSVHYVRTPAGAEWSGDVSLTAGMIYLEPGFTVAGIDPGFLLKVEAQPIVAAYTLAESNDGRWSLRRLRLDHPGVVAAEFSGDLQLAPALAPRAYDLRLASASVARLYASYLQPLLFGTNFGGLATAGSLTLAAQGEGEHLLRLSLQCRGCHFDDELQRFGLYGIEGGIEIHGAEAPIASQLTWEGASIHRLEIGPGRIDWESRAGLLRARAWRDVAIFDGALHIDSLDIADLGSRQPRLTLSGAVLPITLSSLSAAFGWPPLAGQLAGQIPRLTYTAKQLRVDGDLELKVFDGSVRIRDLRVSELFGAVPRLRADVVAEDLDLERLTSTFSFGSIHGRLAGEIRDLRLEAWQPVAFDAYFATPEDDPTPHRISRQAVDNLSRLGAGASSALSQGWLALIPSYSYGRLGVGCTLAQGFCTLRGVAPAGDDSFYILTRGGLFPPWISIKGSGQRIAWQALVTGLQQIARGEWELDIGVGPQRRYRDGDVAPNTAIGE